ncbi:hypothetical protein COT42_06400 [Candidatus Saganbacteria bacterium CG08_land_8_20_14_0_20_45_16]|uniref:Four helix bundle protein n=1 Tax=Candidatus Saganbacteria bacterium CG08_land_8_20_14_0_20_45_16 TaxID=2014293 RepID=A0A2H0XVU1_UNCSA|nr:MAG: hypothetical protein COT42_06400 [Candidatus Saganbacteria bacterium CG08_land_8_20_14_0_20_45_16]
MIIRSVRELEVYQIAFDTAMAIFEISKGFPKEEKYALTDQMRRSSIAKNSENLIVNASISSRCSLTWNEK